MDKAAIQEIIKGIKEGTKALTPIAKEYINQVQYTGLIKISFGVLAVILIGIMIRCVSIFIKKDMFHEQNYNGDILPELNDQGKFLIRTEIIVFIVLLLLIFDLIFSGLVQYVSPLYYLVN